jgi:hypothetical protein
MPLIPSTIVVRGANHTIQDLKITAPQALESRCLADNAAIFFRTSGNGEVPATAYILQDCIIEARGESAIMTDNSAFVGNGIIRRNTIQGQTFVGASAAQVPAFGTMTKSGRVLSNRTIEFSELSGITAPHAGNPQGSEITPGLRVASISGNIVTVTANIPDAIGTTRSFSFGNVQFNFPNVARQLVVLQGPNMASQFLNNTVKGKTGSGISYNTAVTVDMANAVITGNTMNGEFKFGYALRVRGAGATVSNNVNYSIPGNANAGYLIGPTGAQSFGYNIGTNTTIVKGLIGSSQAAGDSFVTFEMNKELVKQNSKVSSDPVYSQESNWKFVGFVYKHSTSSKRLVSCFRSFDNTKKAKLKVNMKAGDSFELHKIIISKADRSFLVLNRSEISGASGFDFSLLNDGPESSGGSGGNGGESPAVKWSSSLKHSELTVSSDGLTVTRSSTAGGYVSAFLDTGYALSGSDKIYFEMNAVQSTSGYPAYGFVLTQGADPVTFNSGNITMPGGYGTEGPRIIMQGSSIYSCGAPYGDANYKGSLSPGIVTGATLGIAIDVAAKTFFFVINGVASSVHSFANEVDAGTKLYIGVGPTSSGDSFVKKTSSSNTPTGYTLI